MIGLVTIIIGRDCDVGGSVRSSYGSSALLRACQGRGCATTADCEVFSSDCWSSSSNGNSGPLDSCLNHRHQNLPR